MMDNHAYNLMNQMVQEHKSLWRIKNEYSKDAGDCQDCKVLWDQVTKQKEEQVSQMADLLKAHLK